MFIAATLFAVVGTPSLLENKIYTLSFSNDKCITYFLKDSSVATLYPFDRSRTDILKDQCKLGVDIICSSPQTGQGAFFNNPNQPDNGDRIIEKFSH